MHCLKMVLEWLTSGYSRDRSQLNTFCPSNTNHLNIGDLKANNAKLATLQKSIRRARRKQASFLILYCAVHLTSQPAACISEREREREQASAGLLWCCSLRNAKKSERLRHRIRSLAHRIHNQGLLLLSTSSHHLLSSSIHTLCLRQKL